MVKTTSQLVIRALVEKEGTQYVSRFPELDVASCGDTVAEAFINLLDATLLYLEGLQETGQLQGAFQKQVKGAHAETSPLF